MEIDVSTYPSRAFIRFTAQNQLIADLTGQPVHAMVQRLGGESYTQQVMPGNQPNMINPANSDLGLDLDISINHQSSAHDLNGDIQASEQHSPAELISQADDRAFEEAILDETLFDEIAKTSFNPNRYPELYQSCGTRRAAAAIEAQVAAEIVAIYQQIKQQQQCSIVRGLNSLL
jgi:hypothetical protein